MTSESAQTVIEASGIVKRFGGAVAVDGVSLSVAEGEIHAVVGENGAGKSTLMRILAGILTPDAGTVTVGGTTLEGGAKSAIDAGIALVHQELSLVPEMTVAENIMLGSPPTALGFTKSKELKRIAAAALDEIGVRVDLDEPIARLSVSLRQFVEIARAVARSPRVLILDEPTATLTPAETDYLLRMLQRLAAKGMAIIYISHRIPEVFSICTDVTILRDGQLVETTPISETTPSAVIDAMVGRELKLDLEVTRESHPGEVVLSATGIRAVGVHDVDLTVRAGEIVGLGGLVGAGRTELVRAIVGADNVALPNRRALSTAGVLAFGAITKFVRNLADVVGLRPPEIQREVGQYSGGNQQKVVIAKWLGRKPKLIILDEPTRGVDVGAKAEIHRLVRELADEGAAVLVVSSDLPELLELSDVIHVVRDGRIQGTLPRAEADEKTVMSLASGETMVSA